MLADSTLPLAVVGGLDSALLLVGIVTLTGSRARTDPRFVACHCSRPHCSGVRRAAAGVLAWV